MAKAMTVAELINELGKFNPEAEALIVLRVDEMSCSNMDGGDFTDETVITDDPQAEQHRYAIASVEDGGWENEDGTSPIIDLRLGEFVMG